MMRCETCRYYLEFWCGGCCQNPASKYLDKYVEKRNCCECWKEKVNNGN